MKALPIMLREISQLEEENQDQIELYIKQKSKFTVGIHMLVDQIDSDLKRDDECRQTRGFQAVKRPNFYPFHEELWAEMPVDIIRIASEEHEECMKSLDDVRAQRQTKHRCWENVKTQRTEGNIINHISFPESNTHYK